MLIRILIAASLALALSACSTAQNAALDTRIAQTSATLAKQCGTVAALIQVAGQFSTKPKVARAVAAAESARAAFCAAPPQDATSAVLTLGAIALSLDTALHS